MTPGVFAVFVFISTVVAAGTVIGLLLVAGCLVFIGGFTVTLISTSKRLRHNRTSK